jgi:putative effector of murein hydrolase
VVYLHRVQAIYAARAGALGQPVLWSVLVRSAALLIGDVAYPVYFSGAQFILFLRRPAVVALGWPLCSGALGATQLAAVAGGLALGAAAASGSAFALGWAAGCRWKCCCRWCPSPSPRRWRWASPRRSAACRRWAAAFAVLTGWPAR